MKKRVLSLFLSIAIIIAIMHISVVAALSYSNYNAVSIDSYQSFRNAVIGKAFDVDNKYGAQCWDGACVLWKVLGRNLLTGKNHAAYECWTSSKNANAGNDFYLVDELSNVKRGDIMVFSGGSTGHIGFADEDYAGSGIIKLLGQNQGNNKTYRVAGISFLYWTYKNIL